MQAYLASTSMSSPWGLENPPYCSITCCTTVQHVIDQQYGGFPLGPDNGIWETRSLPDDALGHAIQAAWIGSKVPSPATSIVLILGPRVDLLKDCIFTASVLQLAARAEDEGTRQRGFWIGVCSLVTLFTPGPFLFCDRASRMEVAKEFLAGVSACRHFTATMLLV